MSITITDQPLDYNPAYSPAIYIVNAGSLINEDNFKYIAEVYNGSSKLAELKSFPNPDHGWGRFDVSTIVQNELREKVDFDSGTFSAQSQSMKQVTVRFGWEYINSSGSFVRVTDDTNDTSWYWNGSPKYTEYVELRQNDPQNGYVLSGGSNHYPLTSRRYIETHELTKQWLYYLTESSTYVDSLEVQDMDSMNTDSFTIGVGGSFIAIRTDKGFIEANTSLSDLQHYRVRTKDSSNNTTTQWIEYEVIDTNRWSPYSLYYLNRWGGIDSMSFTGRSHKEIQTERSTYKTDHKPVSSSGVVDYSTENHSIRTNWTENIEGVELTTDWISHDSKESAIDLLSAPIVWLEDEDGLIKPVNIRQETYRIEDKNLTEPISLRMVVEYQETNKRQQS